MSSYTMAGKGQKRSLNLTIDHTDPDLRLQGYKNLNLNNSFGDTSLIGAAIYSHIARSLMPAPKVNLVRVVINGEDWGIHQNQQQFDDEVAVDTRMSGSLETFLKLTSPSPAKGAKADDSEQPQPRRRGPGGEGVPYRTFADARRELTLQYPSIIGNSGK